MKSPTLSSKSNVKRSLVSDNSEASPDSKRVKIDSCSKTFSLSSGQKMPVVQFGTYKMKGEECYEAVLAAIKAGYRGLDTASVYDNEKEVGRAIADSGLDPADIFVQTKLWRSFVGPAKNGKPKCDAELRKSLRRLGVAKLGVWLMHWPGPGRHLNYPPVRAGQDRPKTELPANKDKMVPLNWTAQLRLDTYREMSKFVGAEVGSLGVCNFSHRQLVELLQFCQQENLPRPTVLQNECHPLLTAEKVRSLCQQEGMVFQAYASLGAGALGLLQNSAVSLAALAHGVTEAQILLRWAVQNNCAVLPKSCKPARMKTNLDLWNFSLSESEMRSLDSLDRSCEGQNTMAGWLREQDPDYY